MSKRLLRSILFFLKKCLCYICCRLTVKLNCKETGILKRNVSANYNKGLQVFIDEEEACAQVLCIVYEERG